MCSRDQAVPIYSVNAPTQVELEFTGLKIQDPYFLVKMLISEVQADLSTRRKHLPMVASKWVIAYRFLRHFEDDIILGEPSEPEKNFYKGAVSILKGTGIQLGDFLQRNDEVDVDQLGFTFHDFMAMVQDLIDTDRSLHSDLTPEMMQEMEAKLFGDGSGGTSRTDP